jgi:ankyrin repeat protein
LVVALASLGADMNAESGDGATPVFIAAQEGHLEVVKALASLGANVNAARQSGATPVFVAAAQGHVEIVRILAWLGANLNTAMNNGATPVFIAARNGHTEVVKALGSLGVDVNAPMNDGATPLFIAAAIGYDRVASALVSLGADVNFRRTARKWTQWYIDTCHVDGEEGDWTPLMIAARNGHAEVVKVLVKAGASTEVKLSDGRTALSLATVNSHDVVAALLAAV